MRLGKIPASCDAPIYAADELLRAEGFTDVRFVSTTPGRARIEALGRGEFDFTMSFAVTQISALDATTRGYQLQYGTEGNDNIGGTTGNDTLYGLGGNDFVFGGAGNDVLIGGPGRDKLVGGPGRDVLRCGSGRDIAYADASDSVGKDCETAT